MGVGITVDLLGDMETGRLEAVGPGMIDSIDIIKPSEYNVLNEAAVRLIRLGEPYAPFPESFRDKVDLLNITRTWVFTTDYGLRGE